MKSSSDSLIGIKFLYLSSIIIYYLQGIAYSSGSFISQSFLFIFIFIGFVFFIKTLLLYNNEMLIRYITLLLLINVVGYVFYDSNYKNLAFNHLKGILTCWLPFFVSYYLTVKNKFNSNLFSHLFYILLIVNVYRFYFEQPILSEKLGITEDKFVNNVSYSFARLIPLLFFIKRKLIIQISSLAIIGYFLVAGAKRGALVCGLVGMLCFLYYVFNVDKVKNRNKIYYFLKYALYIVVLFYFLFSLLLSNAFLINRVVDGSSSGRFQIYSMLISKWFSIDNTLWQLLFGFGFISSVDISNGYLAHNDWFELLTNFGLLGIYIYASIIYLFIRLLRNNKYSFSIKMLILTITIMWLLTTVFSTWFNSLDAFPVMLVLGYVVGLKRRLYRMMF